jgi:hypothetical protein
MTRDEEKKAQEAFIAAGKATILPPFTAQHVAIKLQRQRLAKLNRMRPGQLRKIMRDPRVIKTLDSQHKQCSD